MDTTLRRNRRAPRQSSRREHVAFLQPQPLKWELSDHNSSDSKLKTSLGLLRLDKELANANYKYGTVDLSEKQYGAILMGIPRSHRPTSLCVHRTNPEVLTKLSRTERLVLLRCLSDERVKVRIATKDRKGKYRDLTKKRGSTVDLATVLIMSIALRGRQYSPVVGELIGLSTPRTLRALKKYARPPLVHFSMIFALAHATARNVTQIRAGNDNRACSLRVLRLVPNLIASVIEDVKSETQINKLWLIFHNLITSWNQGDDRGIQVGLVMAGLKLSLRKALEKTSKGWERVNFVLKVIFGGLSGIPAGGTAFAAAQPIVEKILTGRKEKREKRYRKLWVKIWDTFQDKLEILIPRLTEQDRASFGEYRAWLKDVLTSEASLM